MALRAFRSNPSLGGFGGESRPAALMSHHKSRRYSQVADNSAPGNDDDAFAQIVKELVDNAVDACGSGNDGATVDDSRGGGGGERNKKKYRVRVVISPLQKEHDREREQRQPRNQKRSQKKSDNILRITISDNGCGMSSISACVTPFSSSKVSSSSRAGAPSTSPTDAKNTAGRYGLGLTLCLLHAQRLVPRSYASVTSSTAGDEFWTRARYVVKGDDVVCVKEEKLAKGRNNVAESGTAVSLLVPGGAPAKRAWPRLAEYFARFHLSRGLQCSLQVMAPTLSTLPLFVRPPVEIRIKEEEERQQKKKEEEEMAKGSGVDEVKKEEIKEEEEEEEFWYDGLIDEHDDDCFMHSMPFANDNNTTQYEIKENVASTPVPNLEQSHDNNNDNCQQTSNDNHQPHSVLPKKRLYPANATDDDDDYSDSSHCGKTTIRSPTNDQSERHRLLHAVRSYLSRPIDIKNVSHSVQTIQNNKSRRRNTKKSSRPVMETSVIVIPDDENDEGCNEDDTHEAKLMLVRMVNSLPLLDGAEAAACGLVRATSSSPQIRSTWNTFGLDVRPDVSHEAQEMELHVPLFSVRDSVTMDRYLGRSTTHELWTGGTEEEEEERMRRLPAGVRMGTVLILVQIYATPSALPLPTLSKGRLPMNDPAIDAAFDRGLQSCLRQLQKTNPSLLLSTLELKKTEREARHVPAVAAALASIICHSKRKEWRTSVGKTILGWESAQEEKVGEKRPETVKEKDPIPEFINVISQQDRDNLSDENDDDSLLTPKPLSTKINPNEPVSISQKDDAALLKVNILGPLLEERLRLIIRQKDDKTKKKKRASTTIAAADDDDVDVNKKETMRLTRSMLLKQGLTSVLDVENRRKEEHDIQAKSSRKKDDDEEEINVDFDEMCRRIDDESLSSKTETTKNENRVCTLTVPIYGSKKSEKEDHTVYNDFDDDRSDGSTDGNKSKKVFCSSSSGNGDTTIDDEIRRDDKINDGKVKDCDMHDSIYYNDFDDGMSDDDNENKSKKVFCSSSLCGTDVGSNEILKDENDNDNEANGCEMHDSVYYNNFDDTSSNDDDDGDNMNNNKTLTSLKIKNNGTGQKNGGKTMTTKEDLVVTESFDDGSSWW